MSKKTFFFTSLVSLSLFSGCFVGSPSVTEYRISPDVEIDEYEHRGCKKHSLKIAQAFSSSELMRKDMNYALDGYEQYMFSQSQWAVAPSKAISLSFRNFIESTQLFQNVQVSQSRSKNDYLLEINIDDFMQYFTEDEQNSFVKISINLTLIDARTSKVIATKTFKYREDVKSLNAKGGVLALNDLFEQLLLESGEWLGGVCR